MKTDLQTEFEKLWNKIKSIRASTILLFSFFFKFLQDFPSTPQKDKFYTLPGRMAFEKYVNDRRWECYKKNTVVEAAGRKHTHVAGRKHTHVQCTDVPGVINPGQIYYCHGADIL